MNKVLLIPQTQPRNEALASHNVSRWQDLRKSSIASREKLGSSQADFAEKLGITQPAVSQFETLGANPRYGLDARSLGPRFEIEFWSLGNQFCVASTN